MREYRQGIEGSINQMSFLFIPGEVYLAMGGSLTVGLMRYTCGLTSLMSFTLNGDEVGQWLIELNMSPSYGLEMSLINILIFLLCLPHWSGRNLK